MKVIYLRSFLSDLKKIKDQKIKSKIKVLILEIKGANLLEDVENIKKLKGYSMAYRSRIGDYRVGMYKEFESVELARFVKQNDIYIRCFQKRGQNENKRLNNRSLALIHIMVQANDTTKANF